MVAAAAAAAMSSESESDEQQHEQSTAVECKQAVSSTMILYKSLLPSLPMDSIRELPEDDVDDGGDAVEEDKVFFQSSSRKAMVSISLLARNSI
jgi:hypothetical protein